ncbi:MAG: ribosome small subunit-dependent GTPase A [Tenericutes bacterium]|nr:ribosome small subunit-dependent GTPase A [Mycoplasmatota bacterium]
MSKQNSNSLIRAQVITVYKDRYLVEFEEGKILCEVSGRFQYIHYDRSDYPQIGDYVAFRKADDYLGIIEEIEVRKSVLDRSDTNNGAIVGRQILAVNIDIVFICLSLNEDFNTKKLRDFLSLTYHRNFKTIILLTKKDLCDNIEFFIQKTKEVTDNDIYPITVYDESDIDVLMGLIKDKIAVFIGSSGVGKSSITNKLLAEEHFETSQIRLSDAQGRHTTVHRELVTLKNGGKVIDTPGIRIISSYFVDEGSFEDIKSLSEGCRFKNCSHDNEPGCMVLRAIDTGKLDIERYKQYNKALRISRFNKNRELERERMLDKRLGKGR